MILLFLLRKFELIQIKFNKIGNDLISQKSDTFSLKILGAFMVKCKFGACICCVRTCAISVCLVFLFFFFC